MKTLLIVLMSCTAIGQVLTPLASFDGPNGIFPVYGPLAVGLDGHFYGTTQSGGAWSEGTVFKISPAGVLTSIYSFCPRGVCDGFQPQAGLVRGAAGYFYGTTLGVVEGQKQYYGTVFKITPTGKLITLHRFDSLSQGIYPYGTLVKAKNGSFYGTTGGGGTSSCDGTCGTIYRITSSGVFTNLHVFKYTDGNSPIAGLIQSAGGSFYGTASQGGSGSCDGGCGTIFRMTPAGRLTVLHNFNGSDGNYPQGVLVQAADASFYGTTTKGGNLACNCGTIFHILSNGTFTSLYSFSGEDGSLPVSGLTYASDGNLYGTTSAGGNGYGTLFRISPAGVFTSLYSFSSTDGAIPYSGMIQSSDGSLYGATWRGGTSNYGTVFKFTY
jgi:uncharacterized repeat protein (TIGR03803 family)